ncbi:DUF4242 domain-containing protein [Pseudoteredinibacter isoporae]|uniref:DUF4242 domain-containing protein n=1 Tax=Pseudoteredinibacter isoporae TaxID=570281 RepID=UPI00310AD2C9
MSEFKMFVDTHNRESGTFPEKITAEEFSAFYQNYQVACAEEEVISLKILSDMDGGKAFCLTLAKSAEAVKRAHERVGLPFDSISEVKAISPEAMFLEATFLEATFLEAKA